MGSFEYGRFGHAMTNLGDINNDGREGMIIRLNIYGLNSTLLQALLACTAYKGIDVYQIM